VNRCVRNGQEFLLTALARRQGEILSRTAVAELVWHMNFDSNTNVFEVRSSGCVFGCRRGSRYLP
jgi:DNA-binding response OmpR family regulator